jgi:hypothetical protein
VFGTGFCAIPIRQTPSSASLSAASFVFVSTALFSAH